MKKAIVVLSAVIVAALCLMSFAACDALFHQHSYKEYHFDATCEEGGYILHACDCGDNYKEWIEEEPPLGHDPVEDAAVEPTCSSEGRTAGTYCRRCEATLTGRTPIAPLPHTPVDDAAVPATCAKTGLTAGSHCDVCGAIITAQTVVGKVPHSFGEWTTTKSASCSELGEEMRVCSVCEEKETRSVEKLPHTPVVDAAVSATCAKDGLTEGSHCGVCGVVIVQQQTVQKGAHVDENHDGDCDVCSTHIEDITAISTADGLKAIANNLNGKYRLTADISLSGVSWTPIGSDSSPFKGVLYGLDHAISGLSASNKSGFGIFAYNAGTIDGVVLKNVSLSMSNMSGVMGGFAAYNKGTITNCKLQGTVSITSAISRSESKEWPSYGGTSASYSAVLGGICAENSGTVSQCELTAAVNCDFKNSNEYILKAALLGFLEAGYQSSCTYTVFFGSVCGKNTGTVTECAMSGTNKDTLHLKATTPKNHGLSIAKLDVSVGSLVGVNEKTVSNCTATKATIIKTDVAQSSTRQSNMSTIGTQCELTLRQDANWSGFIGQNKGQVTGVTEG